MGLASLGLEIGIFCDYLYSILPLNAILGLDFLGLALSAHRFDLHAWPLFNLGTGGCHQAVGGKITCDPSRAKANKVVGESFVRFGMLAALAHGAKGFIWYCWVLY